MATSPMCSMAAAKAGLDALLAKLNAMSGHDGVIKVFSGALPATCETADPSGALSVGCTFSSTAFNASSDPGSTGLATATAATIAADTSVSSGGTAASFRCYSYDGTTYTCHLQGTVGTSGCDMNLNTTTLVTSGTFTITSCTVTLADGSGAD